MSRTYRLINGRTLTVRPDRRNGLVRVQAFDSFWYVSRGAAASLLRVFRRHGFPRVA